jgi:hypothetical protein
VRVPITYTEQSDEPLDRYVPARFWRLHDLLSVPALLGKGGVCWAGAGFMTGGSGRGQITHVARTLAKLGCRDRVQAMVYAYEYGFVRPGQS